MAKRRKSIRKRPPKIVIELEEDVPEEEEDEIPITTGEHQDEHPDADAVNNSEEQLDVEEADGAGADGVASEDTEEMQRQEKAQEDWNAFKEEHHEIIDQLPLSLYRSMALMRELDDQVQEYTDDLLQGIRDYVQLRTSLAPPPKSASPPAQSHEQASAAEATEEYQVMNNHSTDPPSVQLTTESLDPSNRGGYRTRTGTPSTPSGRSRKASTVPSVLVNGTINGCHHSPANTADGLGEGPSSQQLDAVIVNGMATSPMTQETQPTLAQPATPKRSLVPPNPFALKRSHSSFTMSARKAREKPPQTTSDVLRRISSLAQELVRASEEKLGLASNAYDLADRHVRSLDAAIKGYETSLLLGTRTGTRPTNAVLPAGDAAIFAAGDDADGQMANGAGGNIVPGPAPKRKSKKAADQERRKAHESEKAKRIDQEAVEDDGDHAAGMAEGVTEVATRNAVLNMGMPVNEHEPVYCLCQSVSAGVMIACDGDDCRYEWFHLACVGLKEPPKGRKWFCPDCQGMVGRPKHSKKKRKMSYSAPRASVAMSSA